MSFAVLSAMFFTAGTLLETYWSLQVGDVMTALFAMFFAAFAAGNAAGFGPDMGKAKVAADRIFTIIDYPSQINARDTVQGGIKVNPETF